MRYRHCFFQALGLLLAAGAIIPAYPQPAPAPLAIKAIAQVEVWESVGGRETRKLAPAARVVSGEWVLYTLEVRNASPAALRSPTVIFAVPEHMSYGADSAIGPGADVSYSIDGGHHFDVPDNLKIQIPGGELRAAAATDYTHIRWQLKNPLKANSVAFVRFRAQMK